MSVAWKRILISEKVYTQIMLTSSNIFKHIKIKNLKTVIEINSELMSH